MVLVGFVILINPNLSIYNDLINIALLNHIFRDNCFGPVICRPIILTRLTVGLCVSGLRLEPVILTHCVINI